MNYNPLISVIIPVYNILSEDLRITINSVINQSYQNLQIIIVDDCSNKPFSGVNKEYNDDRIQWILQENNTGVAKARNNGLKIARGEYIAFLDAGDWWELNKLSEQIKVLVNATKEVSLVYCGIYKHYKDNRIVIKLPKKKGDLFRDLLVGQSVLGSCSSVLLKRNFLDLVGGQFYDKEDIPEDRDLWLKLSEISAFEYVFKPLVHIKAMDQNSRSFNPDKKRISYFRFLELHKNRIKSEGLFRQALGNYYLAIARRYLLANHPRKGIKFIFRSLFLTPNISNLKTLIFIIISLFRQPLLLVYYIIFSKKINKQ